jgi:CheY-like chemotaxis protein/DNA-binding XRE family transcriptional regulator
VSVLILQYSIKLLHKLQYLVTNIIYNLLSLALLIYCNYLLFILSRFNVIIVTIFVYPSALLNLRRNVCPLDFNAKGQAMKKEPIMSNYEIGAAIRRRRRQLSLSLEKLGAMLQVSSQQVQRYEKGKNCLSVEKLQKIARALSVPICYFFVHGVKKTTLLNECHEFYTSFQSIQNKDLRSNIINFVKIAALERNRMSVPALRIGHSVRQCPILVVGDDEEVLSISKLFLEYEGYRNLYFIQDSCSVIPFLKEKDVSLIVLDLIMPYIDGNHLLPTLRDSFPNIPIIVMTAIVDRKVAEECLKLGVMDFLVKPVEPERLLSAIDNVMKNK